MKIIITTGVAEGPTSVAAFDAALRQAGVENYNLISLSSIIPPDSTIERGAFVTPFNEYGHRLYVVMARCDADVIGTEAWAGVGWTQEPEDGRGLFVELHAPSKQAVEEAIEASLVSMMESRGHQYNPIQSAITGIECRGDPVCAVVIAVYQSQGWN
jgi:arginine decarboxylase